jgi:hypothetical protein
MKKIWSFVIVAFLAIGICTAKVPDLLGNWTGSATGYVEVNGSNKLVENESVSLSIIEQEDRLFIGNVTYMRNGTEFVEAFKGAIGLDNKTLYIAEKRGYSLGTIISDDEIELIYLERWEVLAAIDKFYRIK